MRTRGPTSGSPTSAIPTKGRVWHPGGAHPFIGLNEALVHNGDFANYHSVCEYLRQRNIFPQFLTDTEVSVLLFDLWNRVYQYPLEYIIEALAPDHRAGLRPLPAGEAADLPRRSRRPTSTPRPTGRGSSSSPAAWPRPKQFQLLGITDTAMLRPQVFALAGGRGVDRADLLGEAGHRRHAGAAWPSEDPRFTPVADTYWNARGGSYTDGGAFIF